MFERVGEQAGEDTLVAEKLVTHFILHPRRPNAGIAPDSDMSDQRRSTGYGRTHVCAPMQAMSGIELDGNAAHGRH
jgi:hypothetical protein